MDRQEQQAQGSPLPSTREELAAMMQTMIQAGITAALSQLREEPPRKRARKETEGQFASPESPQGSRRSVSLELQSQLDPEEEERVGLKEPGQIDSDLSTPDGDSSAEEEGEEEEAPQRRSMRLFMPEAFPKVHKTITSTLSLKEPEEVPVASTSNTEFDLDSVLPTIRESPACFELPTAFMETVLKEWASPGSSKDTRIRATKFYRLPEHQACLLRSPVVDAPVACLGALASLPLDTEGFLKDPHDKRGEMSSRKAFEASGTALKASAVASLANRAMALWCQRLMDKGKIPKSALAELRTMASMMAFAADASFDAMQLSARSMINSVVARRSAWLRNWESDSSAHSKLVALPFKGLKLFGDGLEPFLADPKEKRKILISKPRPKTSFSPYRPRHSFRPFGFQSGFRSPRKNHKGHSKWQHKGQKEKGHFQPRGFNPKSKSKQ